jgi:hypothetical protein
VLPCPEFPAEKPEGGWFWYDMENSRYKCPNGLMFADGNYPYWYSNCTPAKVWDPEEVEECIRKLLEFIWGSLYLTSLIFIRMYKEKSH